LFFVLEEFSVIDVDNGENSTKLDKNIERGNQITVLNLKKMVEDNKVPGRGNGKKLGETFNKGGEKNIEPGHEVIITKML